MSSSIEALNPAAPEGLPDVAELAQLANAFFSALPGRSARAAWRCR